jgi:hypothetical protein
MLERLGLDCLRPDFRRQILCAAMLMLSACTAPMTSPQADAVSIDQFYLQAVAALQKPDGPQRATIRHLTREVDALPSATDMRDPCLEQKRRQLLPILMSLAVIDGLDDGVEQRALRAEALQHLISLSRPQAVSGQGDLCFGRGFPPVMSGNP